MKTMKHNPRTLVLVLVAALFSAALTVSGAFGQGPAHQCPIPRHIHQAIQGTVQNPVPATPVLSDFPNTNCSGGYELNFGGHTMDRCFRHTFSFPPPSELCCQCIEGKGNTLTITYQAIPPVNAGTLNDTFAIYNGTAISGTSQPLYSGTVPTGPVTKTIPLKCGWLAANNRLSFLVQDDTAVLSATVDIDTCCVKK
jgi:hypothetical protein